MKYKYLVVLLFIFLWQVILTIVNKNIITLWKTFNAIASLSIEGDSQILYRYHFGKTCGENKHDKQDLQHPMPAPDSRWCGQDVWRWEMSRRHVTRATDVAGRRCGQCGGCRRVNWHSIATHCTTAQNTPHYCSTRAVNDFLNFSHHLHSDSEKFIDLFESVW